MGKSKTQKYAPGQRDKEREERLAFARDYARGNPKASVATVRYALREEFGARHAEPTLGTDHISAVLREAHGGKSAAPSAPKRVSRGNGASAGDPLERALAALEAHGRNGSVTLLQDGSVKIELH